MAWTTIDGEMELQTVQQEAWTAHSPGVATRGGSLREKQHVETIFSSVASNAVHLAGREERTSRDSTNGE